MPWLEIRTVLALFFLLLIPGWAFLTVTRVFEGWAPLQRWILATAIGICFYPVLFYFSRWILPSFHFGERKIIFLLAILLAIILWGQRKSWRSLFAFERLEWLALLVFAAALFTRFWMAHLHPYPAWSDSLHHTLLTQLVATTGQLPHTLLPYEPSSLDMYHLGLYALSGPVQMLSNAPAYTALLWIAQLLNGLCVLGVYLVLDARGSRLSAITGAVVVGLLSFQPAWYVNWGRFTQVASQAVLLIAWLVTWEAIRRWRGSEKPFSLQGIGLLFAAGLLNAGVFLLHFRLAGLYLPLVAMAIVWECIQGLRGGKTGRVLLATLLVGVVSLVLVLPALIPSLKIYLQSVFEAASAASLAGKGSSISLAYFDTPLSAIFELGAQPWLVALASVALVLGVVFADPLILMMLVWMVLLWGIGNAYRIGLLWLNIMNFSGILIMFYLPISVAIGRAIHILLIKLPLLRQEKIQQSFVALLLFAGFLGSHFLVNGVEDYRYFVTPSDVRAMDWIRANTPEDAVFAINTYTWLGSAPQGTDGGYWIPYFAGRKTTTGTMMFSFCSQDCIDRIKKSSELVSELPQTNQVNSLCAMGVQYAYIGKKGNALEQGLSAEKILRNANTSLLYQQDGVSIIRLCKN